MRRPRQLRAVVGVTVSQLGYHTARTVFAVIGIALAVLALTLLASVGVGVLETGEQKFASADRDLWLTGGPITLSPRSGGTIENPVFDAHNLSAEISQRDDVRTAAPMAFQSVYMGRNASTFTTVVGVGVPNAGNGSITLANGSGFTSGDIHYGDGTYNGPMTHEVIISPQIAAQYNVSVGETLLIGRTKTTARHHRFTVVGVSRTFSQLLGTSTVALHLSELQEISGTAGADRATWLTIELTPDATLSTVKADLERQYPEYEIRTNRQQMQSILQDQALIIAAAGTLVLLALIAGLALTVNVLGHLVYHQQTELAALKAIGLSPWLLVGLIGGQGFLLGFLGGGLGLALTPPAALGLNRLAATLVGFEGLLRTPSWVLLVGGGTALGIGTLSTILAGWQVTRIPPLNRLRP